ncbi:MAG: PadR family transcriptional regulator [Clostridia bacterium]|nr:PadR family transcriptional regulator [Clostridia bacterium]
MEMSELLSGMVTELRRGTVTLCALCKLSRPMYGYNLLSELAECGISVEANTLYPLLRRMEAQGLLVSEWNTSEAKPRKYYQTTELGKELCEKLVAHWKETVSGIDGIINEFGLQEK